MAHPNANKEQAGCFQTTHWSVVLAAGQTGAPSAEAALENLCKTYWYPLYAYIRRQGRNPHDAQDLTQEFFTRILEKRYFRFADRERGRFRSFLLKSLQHFLVNEWVSGQAQKRGGGAQFILLDDESAERIFQQELAVSVSPERLYDKRWAITLLNRAMDRLGADYAASGKGELFEQLKSLLLAEGSVEIYREMSAQSGLSEGATKVAVHRLRQRFRDAVRAEIAQTVATPAEVDEELRWLMTSMSG